MLLRNCEVGRAIIYGLYNEQNEINTMQSILQPRMQVFDLGANQGLFTIVAALSVGPEGKVYAFEPVPSQYRYLTINCQLNRFRNVVLEQMAVSNKIGVTQFFEVAAEQACYSSMRRPAHDIKAAVKETTVRTTDLCSYIRENRIATIDFIKIDIEGGERDVIESASPILVSSSAPIILMEINDLRTSSWGYGAAGILKRFQEWNYFLFKPTDSGLVPHEIQKTYPFNNILLVPKNRMSLVRGLM